MGHSQNPPSDPLKPELIITRHSEYAPIKPTEFFDGPRLKIERAKHHIVDYREAFRAFVKADMVSFVPQINRQTGNDEFIIRLKQPLPSDLRLTAADALYNLRSALDQAVCSCARLAGESPDHTYFPHGANEAGFKASIREKCKKVPEPVRDAITKLQPYHGGHGYLLRVLHDLNVVDKHRDLISVETALRKIAFYPKGVVPPLSVSKPVVSQQMFWQRTEDKFVPSESGIIEGDQQIKVTMAVVFAEEVEAIKGESAFKVLNQLVDAVVDTTAIIEKAMLATLPVTPPKVPACRI